MNARIYYGKVHKSQGGPVIADHLEMVAFRDYQNPAKLSVNSRDVTSWPSIGDYVAFRS